MRGKRQKTAAGLLALLLFVLCLPVLGEEYRELTVGMSGADVQKLKKAMYWLGYFTTDSLDGNYTKTTAERVKQLQKNNGLEETGIADPALQELVFSGAAVKAPNAPKPSPVPTPAPTPKPPLDVSALLPPRTEEGFLAPGAETDEFVYENEEEGVWIYLTPSLSIELKRYEDTSNKRFPLIWFEGDIRCSPESPLTAYLTDGKKTQGKAYANPLTIARKNKVVLGFTDDNFGDRWNGGSKTGVIVRNGAIVMDKTVAAGKGKFPNLEVLAVFDDGSMKTFASDAHTAQEYLDMGAVNTYSFGPILIQDGQLSAYMSMPDYYHYREPRLAIGMIAPYHYYLLAVRGRASDSKGCFLDWLGDNMLAHGVTEAINLDGGGTTALMFMGRMLNKSSANVRSVTSISGFGVSDLVPAK